MCFPEVYWVEKNCSKLFFWSKVVFGQTIEVNKLLGPKNCGSQQHLKHKNELQKTLGLKNFWVKENIK